MSDSDLVGSRIRHLRITGLLGVGGMGAVYEAFDENLHRKVAVKAIRGDSRLDPEARARFLREARILSRLDHPRICRIHESLEEEDGDFLVLELIDGRTLREAMDGGFEPSSALRIAEQLAEVLIAAHEKGVVHRDLKPGNVMLTSGGELKVLDFGLSRAGGADVDRFVSARRTRQLAETKAALNAEPGLPETAVLETPGGVRSTAGESDDSAGSSVPPLSDVHAESELTALGSVVGTLEYLSPEQALGEPVTSASDVYALGLVLQEVFTGVSPHPPGTSAVELMRRAVVAEVQPADGLAPDLGELLRRMQSRAPGGRPSARDVADRLRWIREAPRRRRRRTAVIAGFATTLLVVLVLLVQSLRIRHQAERIEREAEASRQIAEFLVEIFEVSDPEEGRGDEITAREILDRGAARIEADLGADDATRARLMTTMGRVYASLGLYPPAERLLGRGLEIREEDLPEATRDLAESLLRLGELRRLQERWEEATDLLARAEEVAERDDAPSSLAIEVLDSRGLLHLDLAELDRAEAAFREALERTGAAELDPDVRDELEGRLLHNLATVHFDRNELARSIPLARESLELQERRWGPGHPELVESLNNLAGMVQARGDFEEAEDLYLRSWEIRKRVYGSEHPDTALGLNNLGFHYWERGLAEKAEDAFRRAIDAWRESLGPRHGQVATGLNNLATVLLEEERLEEAEALLEESLSIREEVLGPEHPEIGLGLYGLGTLLLQQGRYDEAEERVGRAVEIWRSALGPEHPYVASGFNVLAGVFRDTGRVEEAVRAQRRSLEIWEIATGPDHPSTAVALHNLAGLLVDARRDGEAAEAQRRALEIWEGALDPLHPNIGRGLTRLATIERRLDRPLAAADLLDRAEDLAERSLEADPENAEARIRRALVLAERARGAGETADGTAPAVLWRQVADEMIPLAVAEDSQQARELAALALLSLGRTREARPLVARLVEGGNRDPEILTLAEAQGLPVGD